MSEEEIEAVLSVIQTFDPLGVGASDLQECLLIQLRQQGQLTELFEQVIRGHLKDLAENRLGTIAREMGISTGEVQLISDVIRMLEPKPGRQFASQGETKYIIPDVVVEKIDEEYVVTINDNSTPHLMVSSYYQNLLHSAEKDEALSKYLSDRVNSALWLIKSIEQRKQTIYNVVSAVVRYQKDFFEKGSKYLKTLTLKDIAEEVGIHESTVSRSLSTASICSAAGASLRSSISSPQAWQEAQEKGSHPTASRSLSKRSWTRRSEVAVQRSGYGGDAPEKGIKISRRTVAKYRDESTSCPLPDGRDINFGTSPKGLSIYLLT